MMANGEIAKFVFILVLPTLTEGLKMKVQSYFVRVIVTRTEPKLFQYHPLASLAKKNSSPSVFGDPFQLVLTRKAVDGGGITLPLNASHGRFGRGF
jgi:hypothetical protein